MNLITTPSAVIKDQYIKHPAYENLFVIPYVKNRLVFAELTARAVMKGGFERVLVDLPYFLNGDALPNLPASIFPLVSSLVIQNQEAAFLSIPFVPNDASCAAVVSKQMMGARGDGMEMEYVDDSNILNYHKHLASPQPRLMDDYFVFVDGLERYFEKPFASLDRAWKHLSDGKRFYLEYRAARVAEHVRRALDKGKKTLFVCEYNLWRLVSSILEEDKPESAAILQMPWSDLKAAIVVEDPYRLWALGVLDDYPAVVNKFYRNLGKGEIDSFDKIQVLNSFIEKGLSVKGSQPSIRGMIVFRHFLRNRMCEALCVSPSPTAHLFDGAHSCLGKRTTREMTKVLLKYPSSRIEEILKTLSLHKDGFQIQEGTMEVPDLMKRLSLYDGMASSAMGDDFRNRMELINSIRPFMTGEEVEELRSDPYSVMWEIKPDYELYGFIADKVLEKADRQVRIGNYRVKRSYGSMGAGIHMKATIESKARGENSLYIKKKKSFSDKKCNFNSATPMVFIFSDDLSDGGAKLVHDSNISQRKSELMNSHLITANDPPPDRVYSVYATYSTDRDLSHGHLTEQYVTSIVILYSKHMGTRRYDCISRRNERYQCRLGPSDDPELEHFNRNELGTAWAIKYAEESIIVVAIDGWKLTGSLAAYAKEKGVSVIRMPLTIFTPDLIARLRLFHNISTALKKHPRSEEIVKRFLM